MPPFDLQGHRGARGLKPETTLPSFEFALDHGVSTIETDVHLTSDGIPVLVHDSRLSQPIFAGVEAIHEASQLSIRSLTLKQLRMVRADGNPDPQRFPEQDGSITPLARIYAQ